MGVPLRWLHALVLTAALLAGAPALAQDNKTGPAPAVPAPDPNRPTLPAYPADPVVPFARPTFCSQEQKDKQIAYLEAALATAEANAKVAEAWQKARSVQDAYDDKHDPKPPSPFFDFDAQSRSETFNKIYSLPAIIKDMIAKTKARGVTDCSQFKGVLPPAPRFLALPWAKQDRFCSQKDLDAYRQMLDALLRKAYANLQAAEDYLDQLARLKQIAAIKTEALAKWKAEIDQAYDAFVPVLKEQRAAYHELSDEEERAFKLKPVDCTETKDTPPGPKIQTGAGTTGDGKPSPAPPHPPTPATPTPSPKPPKTETPH